MEESYEHLKTDHNKIITEFEIADGQIGVLIMVDGEIKGFELFLNHGIYKTFHEKILKSYLIDTKIESKTFTINTDSAKEVIAKVFDSTFQESENTGLEKSYDFENDEGLGKLYTYENEVIHLSYFNKKDDDITDEVFEEFSLETDV